MKLVMPMCYIGDSFNFLEWLDIFKTQLQ